MRRAVSVGLLVLAVLAGACRQPSIHVHGRLIDRSSGRPVRGTLLPNGLPPFVTGDDGAFDFKFAELDDPNRAVAIEAVGYARHWVGASSLNGVEIRLTRVERLDGVLRYASGMPVANAQIYTTAILDDAEAEFEPETITTHSSSDGSFSFFGYTPPTRWTISANGMVVADKSFQDAKALGRRADVVIPDLGSLRVFVTKQGAPLSSAGVRAVAANGFASAVTGSDGSVILRNLPPVEFSVWTTAQAERDDAFRATVVSGGEVRVNISTR